MNEREKTSLKFFFSLVDTKKKRAKDRSLSSARRARPAQINPVIFVFNVSPHPRVSECKLQVLVIVIIAGTKRREIQKRKEREKKRKAKPAYAILHVQLHLLLRTLLALHLHLTHVARRPRRRREHFTLHLTLSLFSFLFVCVFYFGVPQSCIFFPALCETQKSHKLMCEKFFFEERRDDWKISLLFRHTIERNFNWRMPKMRKKCPDTRGLKSRKTENRGKYYFLVLP